MNRESMDCLAGPSSTSKRLEQHRLEKAVTLPWRVIHSGSTGHAQSTHKPSRADFGAGSERERGTTKNEGRRALNTTRLESGFWKAAPTASRSEARSFAHSQCRRCCRHWRGCSAKSRASHRAARRARRTIASRAPSFSL